MSISAKRLQFLDKENKIKVSDLTKLTGNDIVNDFVESVLTATGLMSAINAIKDLEKLADGLTDTFEKLTSPAAAASLVSGMLNGLDLADPALVSLKSTLEFLKTAPANIKADFVNAAMSAATQALMDNPTLVSKYSEISQNASVQFLLGALESTKNSVTPRNYNQVLISQNSTDTDSTRPSGSGNSITGSGGATAVSGASGSGAGSTAATAGNGTGTTNTPSGGNNSDINPYTPNLTAIKTPNYNNPLLKPILDTSSYTAATSEEFEKIVLFLRAYCMFKVLSTRAYRLSVVRPYDVASEIKKEENTVDQGLVDSVVEHFTVIETDREYGYLCLARLLLKVIESLMTESVKVDTSEADVTKFYTGYKNFVSRLLTAGVKDAHEYTSFKTKALNFTNLNLTTETKGELIEALNSTDTDQFHKLSDYVMDYVTALENDTSLHSVASGKPLALAYTPVHVLLDTLTMFDQNTNSSTTVKPRLDMLEQSVVTGQDSGNLLTSTPVTESIDPSSISGACAVVTKSKVYVLGGVVSFEDKTYSNKIHCADVSTDSSLQSWGYIGTLPTPLAYSQAVICGGKLWLLGGVNVNSGLSAINTITALTIGDDGTLQTDAPVTHSNTLPEPMAKHKVVIIKDTMYCLGGVGESSYRCKLSNDGVMSEWTKDNSSSTAFSKFAIASVVKTSSKLYAIGGYRVGDAGVITPTNDVYKTDIDASNPSELNWVKITGVGECVVSATSITTSNHVYLSCFTLTPGSGSQGSYSGKDITMTGGEFKSSSTSIGTMGKLLRCDVSTSGELSSFTTVTQSSTDKGVLHQTNSVVCGSKAHMFMSQLVNDPDAVTNYDCVSYPVASGKTDYTSSSPTQSNETVLLSKAAIVNHYKMMLTVTEHSQSYRLKKPNVQSVSKLLEKLPRFAKTFKNWNIFKKTITQSQADQYRGFDLQAAWTQICAKSSALDPFTMASLTADYGGDLDRLTVLVSFLDSDSSFDSYSSANNLNFTNPFTNSTLSALGSFLSTIGRSYGLFEQESDYANLDDANSMVINFAEYFSADDEVSKISWTSASDDSLKIT